MTQNPVTNAKKLTQPQGIKTASSAYKVT